MRIMRLLFCAVLLLLAAACSHPDQTNSSSEALGPKDSTETWKPGDTTAAASSTEASEASNEPSAEVPETAFSGFTESFALTVPPEAFPQGCFFNNTLETPDGLYHIGFHSVLYFCPRGSSFFVPLCGKPNCMHNTMNCNAYVECSYLGYYNGGIYTISNEGMENGDSIIKRNLDGTDHRIVATVNYDDYGVRGGNLLLDYSFDCGKAYILVQEMGEHLIEVDLEDGSQREIGKSFFREKLIGYNRPVFHNGKLYVVADENKANATQGAKLVELDLETEAWRELAGDVDFYVTDSTLYYLELDKTRWGGNAVANPGFRELDLKTGQVKNFDMPTVGEDITGGFYDASYFYARCIESDMVYILSLENYDLVDQFELPGESTIMASTEDRLYIWAHESDNSITHYLDKTQIGSHQLSLAEVEMMVPDIPDVQTFDVHD